MNDFIPEPDRMNLSPEEQTHLAEILINPPPPNGALKRAQKLYMENVEPETSTHQTESACLDSSFLIR